MTAPVIVMSLDDDPIHGVVITAKLFASEYGYATARFPIDEPMTTGQFMAQLRNARARAQKMDWENDPARQEAMR
ncbi:hypothetical protein LRS03_01095 [Rhizobacter sp. J219]|uniref:hypothetical protein n=1 Tax=Rhizobacter sp. J219 TaxID=2898430 RepID=UPI0021519F6F|nr:hypothetical protein [Rhizobacter sp. J219]MCR5881537.1 hypothetical protein [Rhizobacter sp. J219]